MVNYACALLPTGKLQSTPSIQYTSCPSQIFIRGADGVDYKCDVLCDGQVNVDTGTCDCDIIGDTCAVSG